MKGQLSTNKLEQVERQRRHLWTTAFTILVTLSLVVVVMSFWTDLIPDSLQDVTRFPGYRFIFLVLSLGFVVYAASREREFRAVTRQLLEQHQRNLDLRDALEAGRREAEQLQMADRVRADFVAAVTHELKTPLTSIMGYASILRKKGEALSPEERAEYTAVLENQGHRILKLIQDMLQKSRLDAEPAKLQRVPLPLAAIVRDLASSMGRSRDRVVHIEVPDHDLGLFGDPAAMEHVISNLIDNAFKYSPDGKPVAITIVEEESSVDIRVSDEGGGITEEDLPHIFDRYQQAANAHGGASVGLGLYIVKGLVDSHGGRVWAESVPGEGTTFIVSLPRRAGRDQDGI